MSAPTSSIVILAVIDAVLAIAVFAALLLHGASRLAALPAAAGIAAVLGVAAGALSLGDQSSGSGQVRTTDRDPRVSKLEQKTGELDRRIAANNASITALAKTVESLRSTVAGLPKRIEQPGTTPPPSSGTPPTAAKLVIASAQRTPTQVLVRLQNLGKEIANITTGDASFCSSNGLPQPQSQNCKSAPANGWTHPQRSSHRVYCSRTFVCPTDGMRLYPGQVSGEKWATIVAPYTSDGPFRIALTLTCKDQEGRDCSVSLASDPLLPAAVGPSQSGVKRGQAPSAQLPVRGASPAQHNRNS